MVGSSHEATGGLPRELAELLRSGQEKLARQISAEIRRAIPEYDDPRGPFSLESAVEQALVTFANRIADPSAPIDRLAALCRMLGRNEAFAGRSLDTLRSAYQIAFRISCHRATRLCAHHALPAEVVAGLAEAQLEYMDRLLRLSLEGYLAAGERSTDELAELRRRLLRLMLECPPAMPRVIDEVAGRARWKMPAEVTLVALRPGARWIRTPGDDDVLLDLDCAEPRLLIPGPLNRDRQVMLRAALPRDRAAVGLTVPPENAADSLRWARQALTLVAHGVIADSPVTLCEEHLLTLWLTSDPALFEELSRQRLAELESLSSVKRRTLTETLRVWLESWSTAAAVGDQLHVHPQTVRYRLTQIKASLSDQINDPEARFGLELALRALRLRERAEHRNEGCALPSRAS